MAEEKFTLITPQLQHDQPVEPSREQVEFNFNAYANTFARLITAKHGRTPLVILVSGDWGSGKTTLLKTIQSKVAETTSKAINQISFVNPGSDDEVRLCRTVWFNAWKYSDEDQLLVALVRSIVQTMAGDSKVSQVISKLLDPSYPRRNVVETVLSWFAITTPVAEIKPSTGTPRETPFGEKVALLDLFTEAFDRLAATWVHQSITSTKIDEADGALVVFIDDLDRCLPEKVVQVLEAIKLFLDRPGVVFVLAADVRAVQAAVTAHYENAKVTDQRASDYLEKMFQVRFPLPPLSEPQVKAYLGAGLDIPDPHIRENVKLLVAGAEANPRQLKTFVNDLEMGWAMLVNSGQAAGIEKADFIYWLALRRVGASFCEKVQKLPLESRLTYIQKAIKRFNGDTAEAEEFKEWEAFEHQRLRDVLRLVNFSEKVTPERLSQIIFFSTVAVPVEEAAPKKAEPPKISDVIGPKPYLTESRQTIDVQAILAKPFTGDYWVEIPAGPFVMGSRDDDAEASDNERPQHTLELPTFRMARYPITNAQYAEFDKEKKLDWKRSEGKDDHPAVNVSWKNAVAFCAWLTEKLHASGELPTDHAIRLPTEAEWEKAARGEFGRRYSWGDEWDAAKCNSVEGNKGDTTMVGAYSGFGGDSPYRVADVMGNVWEWCNSLLGPYPYNTFLYDHHAVASLGIRVLRGGSFADSRLRCHATARTGFFSNLFSPYYGFRICASSILHSER